MFPPTYSTELGGSVGCIFYSAKSEVKFSTFRFSRTLQLTVTSPFSVATHSGVLPCRVNKTKIRENPQSLYLFAVSAVIAVVWVDSCPWRYGEQHFSRRYVRSGELSPGCQLTSAAGEVRAWSPAAWLQVVLLLLLLRQDRTGAPTAGPWATSGGPSQGYRGSTEKRGIIHRPLLFLSPGGDCGRITKTRSSSKLWLWRQNACKIRLWWWCAMFLSGGP